MHNAIKFACDAVEIRQVKPEDAITIIIKGKCDSVIRVYEVIPGVVVKQNTATAVVSLNNITPKDDGDNIPI